MAETTYHDCKDRYLNDPFFRNLVDLLMAHIVQHKYTPGELRDAAFMAALNFESIHAREVFVRRHALVHDEHGQSCTNE